VKLQKLRRRSKDALESLKKFGPGFKGGVAAIEPDGEEYFLGKTVLETFHKESKKRIPKRDVLFY